MPATTTVCYLLTCDGCGHDFEWDFIPHFKTEFDAYAHVLDTDGAVITEDLRYKTFCANCTNAELHEASFDRVDLKTALGVPLDA